MPDPPAHVGLFRQHVVVAESDIDELGHASNISYLRWVQQVAKRHSEQVGWSYARYLELGAVFVVRRHEIDYLRPAMLGNELELVTWIDGWKAATSVRRTQIRDLAGDVELARAKTTWAMVSTGGGRPMRIPPEVRQSFEGEGP